VGIKRRQIDAETRSAAVLEGLKDESSVAEIYLSTRSVKAFTIVGGIDFGKGGVGPWPPGTAQTRRLLGEWWYLKPQEYYASVSAVYSENSLWLALARRLHESCIPCEKISPSITA
jgi:hypothetical protein